ncbi:hypothetical protein D3C84_1017510 [compost metagenome]
MGDRDAVAVRRGDGVRQLGTAAGGQLAHAGQQVVRAVFALVLEDGLQGIQPFLGFDGIEILHDGLHMFGPTGVGLVSASVPTVWSSTVMAGDILRCTPRDNVSRAVETGINPMGRPTDCRAWLESYRA